MAWARALAGLLLLPASAEYQITGQAELSGMLGGSRIVVLSNPCQVQVLNEAVLLPGWNLVSLPYWPTDRRPASVFVGVNINYGYLIRWDWHSDDYLAYEPWHWRRFGPCLPGEAYWLNAQGGERRVITGGAAITEDQYTIPLPAGGFGMIGNPYPEPVSLLTCRVLMNGQFYPFQDLLASGYFDRSVAWYDPLRLTYVETDVATGYLYPWRGYWLRMPPQQCWLVVANPASL